MISLTVCNLIYAIASPIIILCLMLHNNHRTSQIQQLIEVRYIEEDQATALTIRQLDTMGMVIRQRNGLDIATLNSMKRKKLEALGQAAYHIDEVPSSIDLLQLNEPRWRGKIPTIYRDTDRPW